jgi:hypothetical protein
MPLVGVAETLEIVFWYFNLSNLVMLALTDGKTLLVKYRNASRWGMKTKVPVLFNMRRESSVALFRHAGPLSSRCIQYWLANPSWPDGPPYYLLPLLTCVFPCHRLRVSPAHQALLPPGYNTFHFVHCC